MTIKRLEENQIAWDEYSKEMTFDDKLINGYGILDFNGTKIDKSSLYLEIKGMLLNEHDGSN